MSRAGLQQLVATLEARGMAASGSAQAVAEHLRAGAEASPWYVHGLLGVAAWLAVALLTVTLLVLGLVDGAASAIVTGLGLCAVALVLRRTSDAAFAGQVALAVSLTGIAMSATGGAIQAGELGGGLTLTGVAAVLLVAYPDPLHRFACVLFAVLGASLIAYDQGSEIWMTALGVATAAATAGLWLMPGAHATSGPLHRWLVTSRRSLGHGLAVALVGILAPAAAFGGLTADLVMPRADIATAGITLVLIATGAWIGAHLTLRSPARVAGLALPATLAVALLTHQNPGIMGAALLLGLAQHRQERALLALGGVAAAASLAAFYYQLELSLLAKSLALVASGAILLCARLVIRRGHAPGSGSDA